MVHLSTEKEEKILKKFNLIKDTMNLYEILGIKKTASAEKIKKAYRAKSLLYHPDKNENHKELAEIAFRLISLANEVLSDDLSRSCYDRLKYPAAKYCQALINEDIIYLIIKEKKKTEEKARFEREDKERKIKEKQQIEREQKERREKFDSKSFDDCNTFYEILDVESSATKSEIKAAYNKRAEKYDPEQDSCDSEWLIKQTKLINLAGDVLLDDDKRKQYDGFLSKKAKDYGEMVFKNTPKGKGRQEDTDYSHNFESDTEFRYIRNQYYMRKQKFRNYMLDYDKNNETVISISAILFFINVLVLPFLIYEYKKRFIMKRFVYTISLSLLSMLMAVIYYFRAYLYISVCQDVEIAKFQYMVLFIAVFVFLWMTQLFIFSIILDFKTGIYRVFYLLPYFTIEVLQVALKLQSKTSNEPYFHYDKTIDSNQYLINIAMSRIIFVLIFFYSRYKVFKIYILTTLVIMAMFFLCDGVMREINALLFLLTLLTGSLNIYLRDKKLRAFIFYIYPYVITYNFFTNWNLFLSDLKISTL